MGLIINKLLMNKIFTLTKTATVINYGKKVKGLLEGKCNNNKNFKRK